MESKCPDETLRMRGMNLNLYIMRMFVNTFSLDAAHLVIMSIHYKLKQAVEMIRWKLMIFLLFTEED